jgi:hypothetical protein
MPTLEEIAASDTAQQFGFKLVSADDVPPPPRKKDTDTERWNAIKVLLKDNPAAHGQWLIVKEFEVAGSAPSMASRINGDLVKTFPTSEGWEARSLVTRKKGENGKDDTGASTLYLRFNPPTAK